MYHRDHLNNVITDIIRPNGHESMHQQWSGSDNDLNRNKDNQVTHSIEVIHHNGDSITKYETTSHADHMFNMLPIPSIPLPNKPGVNTQIVKKTVITKSKNGKEDSREFNQSGDNIYNENEMKNLRVGDLITGFGTLSQKNREVNNNISSQNIADLPNNFKNIIQTSTKRTSNNDNESNDFKGTNNFGSVPLNNIVSSSINFSNSRFNDITSGSSLSGSMEGEYNMKTMSSMTNTIGGSSSNNNNERQKMSPRLGRPGQPVSIKRTKTTIIKHASDDSSNGGLNDRDIEFNNENLKSTMNSPRRSQLTTSLTKVNSNNPMAGSYEISTTTVGTELNNNDAFKNRSNMKTNSFSQSLSYGNLVGESEGKNSGGGSNDRDIEFNNRNSKSTNIKSIINSQVDNQLTTNPTKTNSNKPMSDSHRVSTTNVVDGNNFNNNHGFKGRPDMKTNSFSQSVSFGNSKGELGTKSNMNLNANNERQSGSYSQTNIINDINYPTEECNENNAGDLNEQIVNNESGISSYGTNLNALTPSNSKASSNSIMISNNLTSNNKGPSNNIASLSSDIALSSRPSEYTKIPIDSSQLNLDETASITNNGNGINRGGMFRKNKFKKRKMRKNIMNSDQQLETQYGRGWKKSRSSSTPGSRKGSSFRNGKGSSSNEFDYYQTNQRAPESSSFSQSYSQNEFEQGDRGPPPRRKYSCKNWKLKRKGSDDNQNFQKNLNNKFNARFIPFNDENNISLLEEDAFTDNNLEFGDSHGYNKFDQSTTLSESKNPRIKIYSSNSSPPILSSIKSELFTYNQNQNSRNGESDEFKYFGPSIQSAQQDNRFRPQSLPMNSFTSFNKQPPQEFINKSSFNYHQPPPPFLPPPFSNNFMQGPTNLHPLPPPLMDFGRMPPNQNYGNYYDIAKIDRYALDQDGSEVTDGLVEMQLQSGKQMNNKNMPLQILQED